MSDYEFPRWEETNLNPLQQQVNDTWIDLLTEAPATVYGYLSFAAMLSESESALSVIPKFVRWVSGVLDHTILWLAVGERGSVHDRPHCHALFWLEKFDSDTLSRMDSIWILGRSQLSLYDPDRGAVQFMAGKIARGEAWDCSRNLIERLGPFRSSDAA